MYSQTSRMESSYSHMLQLWGFYPSWLTRSNQRIHVEIHYNLGNANAVVVVCVNMTINMGVC